MLLLVGQSLGLSVDVSGVSVSCLLVFASTNELVPCWWGGCPDVAEVTTLRREVDE